MMKPSLPVNNRLVIFPAVTPDEQNSLHETSLRILEEIEVRLEHDDIRMSEIFVLHPMRK